MSDYKIKVGLDYTRLTSANYKDEIQEQLDKISKNLTLSPTLNVGEIESSLSNLGNKLSTQISDAVKNALNSINVDTGTISGGQDSLKKQKKESKRTTANKNTLNKQSTKIDDTLKKYDAIIEKYKKLDTSGLTSDPRFAEVTKTLEGAKVQAQEFKKAIDSNDGKAIEATKTELDRLLDTLESNTGQYKQINSLKEYNEGLQQTIDNFKKIDAAKSQATQDKLTEGRFNTWGEVRDSKYSIKTDAKEVADLNKQIKDLQGNLSRTAEEEELLNAKITERNNKRTALKEQATTLKKQYDENKELATSYDEVTEALKNLETNRAQLNEILNSSNPDLLEANKLKAQIDSSFPSVKEVTKELKVADKQTTYINKTTSKLAKISQDATKLLADHGQELTKYPELYQRLQTLQDNVTTGAVTNWSAASAELSSIQMEMDRLGISTDTVGSKIKKAFEGKFRQILAASGLGLITSSLRTIYQNVVEIDTAMTELRKVTNATQSDYNSFLDDAATRAKALGATLTDVISATADFARLGYDISEASTLADAATIYLHIGDGVDDISEATSSIISTMQAFNIEASDSIAIVDMFNEIGNKFATTSGDIGVALLKSASAMESANNSLAETIAIYTAAQTSVQDADVVGTGIKTAALRIRGATTDLEEAGLDTDGMASSVSKLRDEIQALTGVDLMLDTNTFKSTYQILKEISVVWDEISDTSQANVLELMFGKRQANIGAAILKDFDIAESVLEAAENSTGSAAKEHAIYLDSIQGRLDTLEASTQVLSSDILDDGAIKLIISGLTKVVEIADSIVDILGIVPILISAIATAWTANNNKLIANYISIEKIKTVLNVIPTSLKDISQAISAVKGGFSSVATAAKSAKTTITSTLETQTGEFGLKVDDQNFIAKVTNYNLALKQFGLNSAQAAASQSTLKAAINGLERPVDVTKEEFTALKDRIKSLIDQKAPIELTKIGSSAIVAGSGLKLMGQTIEYVVKSFGKLAIQFLVFSAVSKIISCVVDGVKKLQKTLIPTANQMKETAEESQTAYAELKDEIANLNSEFETTQEKIDELQSKGSLSLTEQEELKQLKLQNAELERSIALQEDAEEKAAKQSTEDTWKTYKTYDNNSDNSLATYNGKIYSTYGDLQTQIATYTTAYNDAIAAMEKASDSGDSDALSKALKNKEAIYEELQELLSDGEAIVANVEVEYLSDTDATKFEALNESVTNAMLATGQLSLDDLIGSLSSKSLSDLQSTMLELAKLPNEIPEGSTIFAALGIDEESAAAVGLSAEKIRSHILSLVDIKDVISRAGATDAIQEFAKSANDITFTNFKKAVGEELVQSILDADAAISESDLIEYIENLREELEQFTVNTAVSELSDMTEAMDVLTAAYQDFEDNNTVTIDSLAKIKEAFSDISGTNEFQEALSMLGVASSLEEVNAALNKLVSTYFASDEVLNNLTDDTKELYAAKLEEMGITNALEIVETELLARRLENAAAGSAEEAAAIKAYSAYMTESSGLQYLISAEMTAAEKADFLRQCMAGVTENNFVSVVKTHAQAILAVGTAAGASGSALVEYANIMKQIAVYQKMLETVSGSKYMSSYINKKIETLTNNANSIMAKALSQFNSLFGSGTSVSYKATTSNSYKTSSSSSSSSSTKTAAELRKEAYDDEKAYLDHCLKMEYITYDTYYTKLAALGNKYFKGQTDNIEDYREHLEDLADVRKETFDYLRDSYKERSIEQEDNIDVYYKNISNLIKTYLSSDGNAADKKEALAELAEDVMDYWEDKIKETQDLISDKDKFDLWTAGTSALTYWNDLWTAINKSRKAGTITAEQFEELAKEIRSEMLDAAQDIYDTYISNIEDIVDLTSDMLKQEANDMIDALEAQADAFSDLIDKKKELISLSQDEIKYQKELKNVNKSLTELQAQAALLALDTSREGKRKYAEIQEQIKEKQEELESLQTEHAQDATVDALDKAVDMFDKRISEQTETIKEVMDNAGLWLQRIYEYIEKYGNTTLLQELLNYNSVNGDGKDSTVLDMWNAASDLLTSNGYDISTILNGMTVEDWLSANVSGYSSVASNSGGSSVSTATITGSSVAPDAEVSSTASALIDAIHAAISNQSTSGKVFHDGLSAGFVGGDTPNRDETYALLRNDELVLNSSDQARIGKQLRLLSSVTDMFSNINTNASSVLGAGTNNNVGITINSPITINGNADESIVAQLDNYADKIASRAMDSLQDTMKKKGMSSRLNYNILRK